MIYFYLFLTMFVGVIATCVVISEEKRSVLDKDEYNASDFEIIEQDA